MTINSLGLWHRKRIGAILNIGILGWDLLVLVLALSLGHKVRLVITYHLLWVDPFVVVIATLVLESIQIAVFFEVELTNLRVCTRLKIISMVAIGGGRIPWVNKPLQWGVLCSLWWLLVGHQAAIGAVWHLMSLHAWCSRCLHRWLGVASQTPSGSAHGL